MELGSCLGSGADMFPFRNSFQATQTHFLVRDAQKSARVRERRRGELCSDSGASLSQPESRPFEVPARHGRQGRSTHLQLAFGQMTRLPPRNAPRASKEPVTVWIIRVWEEQAPEGEKQKDGDPGNLCAHHDA
jgi:hypothetical protein